MGSRVASMVRQSLAEAISVAALASVGLVATVFGPFWPIWAVQYQNFSFQTADAATFGVT